MNAIDSSRHKPGRLKSALLLAFAAFILLYSAVVVGDVVARYGFRDCDTCWLLATGREICLSGKLPPSDPFSFTLPLAAQVGAPQPFIMHQWLCDVLFYCAFKAGGLVALTVLTTIVVVNAFLTLSLRLSVRSGAPLIWSVISVAAATLAARYRFLVRPEIFTCFLLVLWLSILYEMRRQVIRQQKLISSWPLILAGMAVIAAWVNLHSGFASALLLLVLYLLVGSIEWIRNPKRARYPYSLPALLLLTCMLSTLINPYGINLLLYLPRLFFSPIGRFIEEMRSFRLGDLLIPEFYTFSALALVTVWHVYTKHLRKSTKISWHSAVATSADPHWYDAACVLSSIAAALHVLRFVPFVSLILVAESSVLFGQIRAEQLKKKGTKRNLISNIYLWSESLRPMFRWRGKLLYLVLNLLALCGLAYGMYIQPLQLPQMTPEFIPPFDGLKAFLRLHPNGHIFCEDRIGDMLIWYQRPVNNIFMDTRVDLYGELVLVDYLTMLYAQPGWRRLLDTYDIKSVFIRPETDLAYRLPAAMTG